MILDRKDVFQFRCVAEGANVVRVSGIVGHSALAVVRIDTVVQDGALILLPKLVPARKGLSGAFKQIIEVPDRVDQIRFGQSGTTIWTRPRPT